MSTMNVQSAKDLLIRIKKEIYRRSGMDENGNPLLDENMRHFNQPILSSPDDSLFELGYTDDVIRALNGTPIINTLLNIADYKDLRLVHEYDPIPGAFDIDLLNALLDKMESEDFDSATSSCRSACTGLCVNNCTSSCIGGCENSCSMCTDNCSSGCETTCTGCTESCGTTCGISCGSSCVNESAACSGCSAGCTGCTGCSDSCSGTCNGCDYTCSNTCTGGLTSSTKINIDIPILTLFHNAEVWNKIKTPSSSGGKITLPSYGYDNMNPYLFNDIGYIFQNDAGEAMQYTTDGNNHPCYWVDESNNLFKAGEDIYYATTQSQYNNHLALSRKATMSKTLKSFIIPQMAKFVRYQFDSKPEIVTDIISDEYVMNDTSWVYISASRHNENVTGFSHNEYGIYINGKYVDLPFKGVLLANDSVSVIHNSNITYKIKHILTNRDICNVVDVPVTDLMHRDVNGLCEYYDIDVNIENDELTYTLVSSRDCAISDHFDDASHICDIVTSHTSENSEITTDTCHIRSNLMLGADKKYHGFIYSISIDYYAPCEQLYTLPYYGDSDKLYGSVVLTNSDDYFSVMKIIKLTEVASIDHSGSKYKYQFTIPIDINAVAFCDDAASTSIKFFPGNTYTIYTNQSIVLHPVLE